MLAALAASTLFLTSYLAYHFQVGSVRFTGQGFVRALYFVVLISHTILAVAIVPLVLITLSRALAGRFEAHKGIARWTLPLWLYVSVTGVVVYWMLYRL
jgi:putative membrane protein